MNTSFPSVLTINGGSSSIKFSPSQPYCRMIELVRILKPKCGIAEGLEMRRIQHKVGLA